MLTRGEGYWEGVCVGCDVACVPRPDERKFGVLGVQYAYVRHGLLQQILRVENDDVSPVTISG